MSTVSTFPTSQIQQANWFLYQLNPTGLADKLSIAIEIKSAVDIAIVRASLQALTERHPQLRSLYHEQDQQLVQTRQETVEVNFETVDISAWTEAELNQQLLKWQKHPFNLTSGSVFRAFLLTRSASESILLLTLHQMAGDWESLLILVEDFLQIYQAKNQGNFPNLTPLNLSYTDWVQAEINLLNSAKGKQIWENWQQQLGNGVPVLELPTNLSRSPLRTYNGKGVNITIDSQIYQRLQQLAQIETVSVQEVLLAAFYVLLYRYTAEEDLLVGVLQNRDAQPEFKGIVGNLTNVIVTRHGISGDLKFTDFLIHVSKALFELRDSINYPFARLVQNLKLSNLNAPPLCQAGFEYYSHHPLSSPTNLEFEFYPLPQQKVDFDLSLAVTELTDSFLATFNYNCEVLDTVTVEQMSQQFQTLLLSILTQPDTPIDQFSLLSEAEKQQILINWNTTQTDYPQGLCLHDLFEQQVDKTPDAIAVIFAEEKLTYSQLNHQANQLAHYLQTMGVKPQMPVGLCVNRSLEMVVGLLAILKAGGAYVPLDPSYPTDRLAYMISDANLSVLLTQTTLLKDLPEHSAQIICLDQAEEKVTAFPVTNVSSDVQPYDLGYIIYTSGSTGKPKGVAMGQGALVNLIHWQRQQGVMAEGTRTLQFAPISFDVSFQEIFSTWFCGGTLVLVSQTIRQDSFALMQFMAENQIHQLFLPFVALQQLAAVASQCPTLPPLREIVTAGEQLQITADIIELIKRLPNCRLQNQYGPSESHVVSAYTLTGEMDTWPTLPPIGRPIANSQLYILNRHLQPVPIGVCGELYIGGVGIADGYLNRPQLTAAKFITNPFNAGKLYKTGDIARYLPDGNIEFLGRRDNQVKIRGFRIEMGEIEATLTKYPQVKEAVLVVREDQPGNKRLVAYVVPETTSNLQSSETTLIPELKQYLKQKLAEYMVPAAFVILEKLPLTPSGKVNRRGLPAPDISSFGSGQTFVAPRDQIEQQLAEIWSEILNINPVGIKDNFFELGGHSLLAVRLIAKIQKSFQKQLPLATLFTQPTLEELASVIRDEQPVQSSSLVPLQTQGNQEPFFCVHPAGGHVFYYRDLSHYLGKNQPFYGLQAQGFNEGETIFTTVEEMASFYIQTLQEFKPKGPYKIGGWSFGGVVAFEMAQQLLEQGEEVSLLALLDPWAPILLDPNKQIDHQYMRGVLSRYFGGMFGITDLVSEEELTGLDEEAQIEFIIDKAEKLGLFPLEASREQNRRFVDVIIGTLKATYYYQRRPYPGKVTVFRAQEKHPHGIDPQLVWVEMYAILDVKDIEVVMVPGDHFTFIKEPNIQVLAERLSPYLK